MAKITMTHRIRRAVDFVQQTDITKAFVGISRTSPWANESSPPEPSGFEVAPLAQVIGYKAVSSIKLVIPDETGTIRWRGQTWKEIAAADAYSNSARWVYISALLGYNELPMTGFRQVGLYTNLQRASGVTKDALIPSEVADPGRLEILDNRELSNRNSDSEQGITFIFEF